MLEDVAPSAPNGRLLLPVVPRHQVVVVIVDVGTMPTSQICRLAMVAITATSMMILLGVSHRAVTRCTVDETIRYTADAITVVVTAVVAAVDASTEAIIAGPTTAVGSMAGGNMLLRTSPCTLACHPVMEGRTSPWVGRTTQ